jgi:hypothetical protein
MEQTTSNLSSSRRTKAQMLKLLSEYDKNHGLTVKAFCELHQISEGSFYYTRNRHRSAVAPQPQPSGFITIPRPVIKETAGILFAEVNGIKLYQPVDADFLKSLAL